MGLLDYANQRVHDIYTSNPVSYDLGKRYSSPQELRNAVIANRPIELLAGSYPGTPEQIAYSSTFAYLERSQTTVEGTNLAKLFCNISLHTYGPDKHLSLYENDKISGVDCLRKIDDENIQVYQLTATPHTKNGDGKTGIDRKFKELSQDGHEDFPDCKFHPIYGILIGEQKWKRHDHYELYQGSYLWQQMSGSVDLYGRIFSARIDTMENLNMQPHYETKFFKEAVESLAGLIDWVKSIREDLPTPPDLELEDRSGRPVLYV